MFKGYRWQLLALLTAVVMFGAVLLSRSTSPTPQPTPPSTQAPTPTQAPTLTPTAESNAQTDPLPTPQNLPSPSDDGIPTYREALIGQVQRLNPLYASLNAVDADITALIYEGLTRINEFGETVGALAQSWVVSSDSLEYVFTLREDVLWQDGTPFNADDVVYTMAILRSVAFDGQTALNTFWRTVETDKLGDYLVRFRLTQPYAGFLDALRIGILPEHALQGTDAAQLSAHPFNLTPIGTGAYQLEAIRTDGAGQIRQVDLRVAPNYRLRPEGQTGYAVERVSFKLYPDYAAALAALESGEVDGLAARNRQERPALNQQADSGRVRVYNGIEPSVGVLMFNWQRAGMPFQQEVARQALYRAIDRRGAVQRTMLTVAVPADSPMLLSSWVYDSAMQPIPADINAARNLWAQVQFAQPEATPTPDPNATPPADSPTPEPTVSAFTVAILTLQDESQTALTQAIAEAWAQLGVLARVDAVDLDTYTARLDSGDFDAALVELSTAGTADPDVYAFWHQGQYPDGKNYGGVDDRVTSEILEQARRDPNGINRAVLYSRFQREFINRALAVPLYYPIYTYAVAPTVNGVQLGFIGVPSDRFKSIREWTLNR